MDPRVRQAARRCRNELRLQIARLRGRPVTPPVGRVRFGDLRRTTPIAREFGYQRGGPVDRYYIEGFLDEHRGDIAGRVLEIGDDAYIRRFGGARVTKVDVLHVDPAAPGVTFVGGLEDDALLPDAAFDCIILTQTLQFIFDFQAALRNIRRSLAPGGVLLMTVPFISQMDDDQWAWHYSFTHHAVRRMCDDCFPGCTTELRSHGNVLTAVAFLHGLGVGELTRAELDEHHAEHSLVHTARVETPTAPPHGREAS
jgi:SAM-dependent methyltransferase